MDKEIQEEIVRIVSEAKKGNISEFEATEQILLHPRIAILDENQCVPLVGDLVNFHRILPKDTPEEREPHGSISPCYPS